MFNIFKKRNIVSDISWLGIDIHSHILPGIDDGSQTIENSLKYISGLKALGFERLYFTPHILSELYPNTPLSINTALDKVRNTLSVDNTDVVGGAAAEYMIDYDFRITSDLLTLPGNRLLIEMSYLAESPNIEQTIFDLQVLGYTVILAHPERYNFYHSSTSRYLRLKEMGCLFQLNLLSVTGYYGKGVKNAYEYLIGKNMYDLAATDLHHDKHLGVLTTAVQNGQIFKLIGNYNFKNRELFG